MTITYPVYPSTTYEQAVTSVVFTSNQLHQVINGDNISTVEAEDGPIPTVRKVLKDIEELGSNQFRYIFSDENIVSQTFATYMMDVSLVPLSVTLPENPNEGEWVAVIDSKQNAETNNIIIQTTDGKTIGGAASPYSIAADGSKTFFIYDGVDSWSIIEFSFQGTRTPAIIQFDQLISEDFTISTGKNALSVDPTVSSGVTVTVPVNSTWVVL